MTENEIDQLEAGRALDRLVSELVMDIAVYPGDRVVSGGIETRNDGDEPYEVGYLDGELPHYSTTWEGAGMVLDALADSGVSPTLYPERPGWICEVERFYVDDDESLVMAYGETAALAICRTALKCKAVGVGKAPGDEPGAFGWG
jgi:hypothetical protein